MKLNRRQKETLQKLSKHHTKKHMDEMIKSMKTGTKFGSAHKKALKKVGK